MKISIIGSRNFTDESFFKEKLDNLLSGLSEPITIISGGAKGADLFAKDYAKRSSYEYIEFKPDWKKFGRSAGVIRNTEIVESADWVIAFWDNKSKGTLDSIKKAQKLDKKITIVQTTKDFN